MITSSSALMDDWAAYLRGAREHVVADVRRQVDVDQMRV